MIYISFIKLKKKCKTFLAYKLYLSHLSGSCQVFCPFYLLSLVLGVLFWVCCITFNIWRATRGDRAKRLERSVSDSFLNASKASIYKPNFSLHYLFHRYYHMISWGVPLIFASLPFSQDVYGPAGPWWWVEEYSDLNSEKRCLQFVQNTWFRRSMNS